MTVAFSVAKTFGAEESARALLAEHDERAERINAALYVGRRAEWEALSLEAKQAVMDETDRLLREQNRCAFRMVGVLRLLLMG